MPFNQNIPVNGTLGDATPIRENFVALKALIDATPAGPPGPKGDRGIGIQSISDTGGALLITTEDNSGWGPYPLPAGPAGQNGEVSTQQMNDAIGTAIAGTSNNSNAVQLLDTSTITDPVQLEQANKINELINALRR